MAEDELGALLRGLYPPVIEGYTPNQGQRILDRREDQTVVQDPFEFQPWYGRMAAHPLLDTAPPVHSSNPMAQQLGYNDIKKPTPEEMARFLANISAMDEKARAIGPDMRGETIESWLRKEEKIKREP